MSKLSIKNTKHASPAWLVNLTAALTMITMVMPGLIDKMPGTVSETTKDWLHLMLEFITAIVGIITALSRKSQETATFSSSDVEAGPGGTDPNKPRGPI